MRRDALPRLEAKSLKAQCVDQLERLVISGELEVGETLPPERELAKSLGVSRPVLHEAIVELASRGFLAIEPRRGVKVRDYYREGTMAILESIVLRDDWGFPPEVIADAAAFRRLIELECARLAAGRRGGDCAAQLEAAAARERELHARAAALGGPPSGSLLDALTEFDVGFHALLARASGSRVLPLVMNSIAPAYRGLVRRFYATGPDLARLGGQHAALATAILEGRADGAVATMEAMLAEGVEAVLGMERGEGRDSRSSAS